MDVKADGRMRSFNNKLWIFLAIVSAATTAGCGRSLEDEMRAKAAAMVNPTGESEEKSDNGAPKATADRVEAETVLPVAQPVAPSASAIEREVTPVGAPPEGRLPAATSTSAVNTSNAASAVVPKPLAEVSGTSPAAEILSPIEAKLKSAENLEKIAAALVAYCEQKKSLPNPATTITRGETEVAMLSWRVTLLPYLGYDSLYKQFRLNEPWNSPHNKKLLAQIPPEYQSPHRLDVTTNYLVPVGNQTAYSGGQGRIPAHFTAGAENVIMLLEVDDSHAVPWTAPEDLFYQADAPRIGIGSLRQDATLVALANGVVGQIPNEVTDSQLREVFTIDEDSAPAGTLVKSLVATTTAVVTKENVAPAVVSSSNSPISNRPAQSTASPPLPVSPKPGANELVRLKVPDDRDVQVARTLLRDLYRQDYANAKTLAARQQLASEMTSTAPDLIAKPAEAYELLRVSREIAVANGLVDEAVEADQVLAKHFDVDGLAMRARTLDELSKRIGDDASAAKLIDKTTVLMREALEQDQHSAGLQVAEVYIVAHRLAGKSLPAGNAEMLRDVIKATQKAYADVPEAIQTLERNPTDATANSVVGKYYCLVKHRWEDFLPLLVKGDEIRLRVVATIDLETSIDAVAILQLADHYWEMADDYKMPYNLGLRLRAIHYYKLASNQPVSGLAGIRSRKRLQEWNAQPEWVRLFAPVAIESPADPTD